MIRADMIPDEVVEAYLLARSEGAFTPNELIAAAINAWPDVVDTHPNNIRHLVLQFKEVSDE